MSEKSENRESTQRMELYLRQFREEVAKTSEFITEVLAEYKKIFISHEPNKSELLDIARRIEDSIDLLLQNIQTIIASTQTATTHAHLWNIRLRKPNKVWLIETV